VPTRQGEHKVKVEGHCKKNFSGALRRLCILACKNAEKYAISTLIFWKFFWGHSPQTPILGRGYGAPPQTPPPSALRRFAPPRLARNLRSLHRRVWSPKNSLNYTTCIRFRDIAVFFTPTATFSIPQSCFRLKFGGVPFGGRSIMLTSRWNYFRSIPTYVITPIYLNITDERQTTSHGNTAL